MRITDSTGFGGRLVIASNRDPYVLKKGCLEKTVGGLVSALDPLMRETSGVWLAAGDKDDCRPLRTLVPPGDPSYTVRRVPLSGGDMEGYYNGYSNRFLWPLCHMTLDRVYLLDSYWRSYVKVNRLFAEAAVEEAGSGAAVWLQDYHLALCAAGIKARSPGTPVAIFWHIPWPPYAVFRIAPQRRELLEGLLANDLIGFQINTYMADFMDCVERELSDAHVDRYGCVVTRNGHTTRLRAFPISVDFGFFENAARSSEADEFIRRFLRQRKLDGRFICLSVNRLDYTKGMLKCLDAVELFFSRHPRYREAVTFVQVAVPTRKVEPFLSYMERVQRRVEALNAKLAVPGWRPIEYITTNLNHTELAALYRRSGLAIIGSVYDGMNLVAKEYLASQVDLTGCILISELAGVSEEVPGVTVINPYDTEGFARAIRDAIEADQLGKKEALRTARAHIRENDIYKWVRGVSAEIGAIRDEKTSAQIPG